MDYHKNIQDTFYVVEGTLRMFLQEPKEEVRLTRGQTYAVPPKRPHLVTSGGDTSAVFLVLRESASTISCPHVTARRLER